MATFYNAGYAIWMDGSFYTAASLREFEGGVSVQDAGTATTVAPAGGVFPSTAVSMKVTAPASGLTVNVSAGYCAVPNSSAAGVYRFGLLQQASLTVASNATGQTRKDYVVANVQDLGSGSSHGQVEYITGTTSVPAVPSNSIILAEVDVTNGASNITSGMITDKRSFVIAPGGIIPLASLTGAPSVPTGQLMYSIAANQLAYSPVTVITEILTGSGTWACPTGTTAVKCEAFGAGAGGDSLESSFGGAGAGGGGEYAQEPALGVTAGRLYSYSCGTGGGDGVSGTATTFAGDSVTVTANGGLITASSSSGGAGGTGSTNSIHFAGGSGGNGAAGSGTLGFGGGGGASGSALGAGANGGNATSTAPGSGGVPAGGGGTGGNGSEFNGGNGRAPGGGGGGGGGVSEGFFGGTGASGQIMLTYTVAPGAAPYPLAPSQEAWYAYNPSTGVIATAFQHYYYWFYYYGFTGEPIVVSLTMTADGVSDYAIQTGTASVANQSGGTAPAQLVLLIDGVQVDAVNLSVNASGHGDFNWTYYTSGAQGTTMSPGNHVISLAMTSPYSDEIAASGPAFLKVARSLS